MALEWGSSDLGKPQAISNRLIFSYLRLADHMGLKHNIPCHLRLKSTLEEDDEEVESCSLNVSRGSQVPELNLGAVNRGLDENEEQEVETFAPARLNHPLLDEMDKYSSQLFDDTVQGDCLICLLAFQMNYLLSPS